MLARAAITPITEVHLGMYNVDLQGRMPLQPNNALLFGEWISLLQTKQLRVQKRAIKRRKT